MLQPVFLDLPGVLALHRDLIGRYGGSLGVRDKGLLASAIQMPQATFGGEWLHPDIFHMAAAFLFHLMVNHAFVDGNKRVGASAAFVFLRLNGFRLTAPESDYEALVLAVSRGEAQKDAIAKFFRDHAVQA